MIMKTSCKINAYEIFLLIGITLITLSSSRAVINTAFTDILEYLGYGIIFILIVRSYFKLSSQYRMKYINRIAILLTVLFSLGIVFQDLRGMRKIILLFTMIAIVMMSILSENLINSPETLRKMAYACVWGVVLSMILCLFCKQSLWGSNVEAAFGIYKNFNGGIRDKNIATIMLAIIISLYMYKRECGINKSIDNLILVVAFLIIILSNSRGAWIHTLVFFVSVHYRDLKKVKQSQRLLMLFMIMIIALVILIDFYNNFALKSSTYMFRVRGLTNYLNMFKNDTYHMWLGNAGMVYDKELDYVQTIRSITGWDGSLEIAWLDILIKNGILGIIGFFIIFIRATIIAFRCKNYEIKSIYVALIVTLLCTSFVATYIQTVHSLFGMYCYLLMAYLAKKIHMNELNSAKVLENSSLYLKV